MLEPFLEKEDFIFLAALAKENGVDPWQFATFEAWIDGMKELDLMPFVVTADKDLDR